MYPFASLKYAVFRSLWLIIILPSVDTFITHDGQSVATSEPMLNMLQFEGSDYQY